MAPITLLMPQSNLQFAIGRHDRLVSCICDCAPTGHANHCFGALLALSGPACVRGSWFGMAAIPHNGSPLTRTCPSRVGCLFGRPSAKVLNAINRALAELKFDPKVILAEGYEPSWPEGFRSLVEMKPSAVGLASFDDCIHAYGVKITWRGGVPLSFTV
ncbi:MAG: hypothetical protein ACKER6_00515 [Candidatus Hodgkinia cicadicola]